METNGNGEGSVISELLCSYDCYEQTYASAKPILFAPPNSGQITEARRQALYRLPMLVPPGPVPIGFCWYAKIGDDYMNFRLDSERRVRETSVLVIRREGRYAMRLSEERDRAPFSPRPDGTSFLRVCEDVEAPQSETKTVSGVVHRQGITLFAWNRGVVLEDRLLDRTVEAEGHFSSVVGTTNQVVSRLIRSCPENMATIAFPFSPEREGDCATFR